MATMDLTFFLQRLGNLVVQEASLFGEVEGQVRLLRNELEWMRLVLEDADADAKCNTDKRLKLWLNQIRDAAYDSEDVVDEFMFDLHHKRQQRLRKLKFLGFLPSWVSFADKLPLVHELDGRIREINVAIDKILANESRYNIESPSPWTEAGNSSNEVVVGGREKRPPVDEEVEVVGMKNEMEDVKKMLYEGEMERQVVAIVGMGGLGKTTLAKQVYNHDEVKHHFHCRALAYVSQDYRIRDLLMVIANCVMTLDHEKKTRMSKMADNDLGKEVSSYLNDRRYLIVLDDIWSTRVWDGLSPYFPENSNKSRVLITTRNQEIASHAFAGSYPLRHLGETESWELLLKKTFGSAAVCPEELEILGKKITEKCKGLPLAIVVLGGVLSRKEKTKSSWEKALQSMEWHLNQGPDSCLGILALSYNDLPYYLKSCFLYCGIFPEDHEIKKRKLTQMWVAEGFVQKRGEETMEDVGEDYLEELIHRSMIQVAKRKSDGRVKSCRIHDLLRDLATSKAKDSKFFEVHGNNINSTDSPISIRRLIAHDVKSISQHLQSSRLRSVVCSIHVHEVSSMFSLVAKLLTLLDLRVTGEDREDTIGTVVPREIGQLIHLKYFSLKGASLLLLPWSIGKLVNLQVLDLRGNRLSKIPCSIWKLQQLRHLYIPNGEILRQPMMNRWVGGDLGVHQMNNLQFLYVQGGCWSRESRGIRKLTQLTRLYLYGAGSKNSSELYPPNLVELQLKDSYLNEDPMLTLGRLPNLRALKILEGTYFGKRMTCSPEDFPRLEFLRLCTLFNLQDLTLKSGAMPVLTTLEIIDCFGIKKLIYELLQLKNLRQVKLMGVNGELIKEIETTEGEEFDRIRDITSIIEDEGE